MDELSLRPREDAGLRPAPPNDAIEDIEHQIVLFLRQPRSPCLKRAYELVLRRPLRHGSPSELPTALPGVLLLERCMSLYDEVHDPDPKRHFGKQPEVRLSTDWILCRGRLTDPRGSMLIIITSKARADDRFDSVGRSRHAGPLICRVGRRDGA